MSNNIDLHGIIMQQSETIAKLSAQLATFVLDERLTRNVDEVQAVCQMPQYSEHLQGSELVREHFRRGGGELLCFVDDTSDDAAISDAHSELITGVGGDGRFKATTGSCWIHAVAVNDACVLTASELLG